ncbi:MAG: transposase [Planctomycetes bacterium]|nr:transposase [Planctomycetota bacterium]MCB9936322.1 transposase [Planctomycetota bacterium]
MRDQFTPTLAWHLTFTTRGTWLHGDERRSVSRNPSVRLPPDPFLHEYMKGKLKHPPVTLDASSRKIVREAIEGYCRFKNWPVLALNVRSNHVHVVIKAVENSSKMLNAIKARATRMLREAGKFDADRPIWTERGNQGRLLTEKSVNDAINYVLNEQGPEI